MDGAPLRERSQHPRLGPSQERRAIGRPSPELEHEATVVVAQVGERPLDHAFGQRHPGRDVLRQYGGLKISQVKRIKDIERENTRLKKAVADLTLDKVILKEALEGNY